MEQVPAEKQDAIRSFLNLVDRNRILPFGAMIRNATIHLAEHGPLDNLSRLYVDEYQDVNPAQVALIKNMLPEDGEVVGVGDDMQCIYQWRGSDVNRILNFEEDFSDSTTFVMETNYRSRPEILDTANTISSHMTSAKTDKELTPNRPPTSAGTVQWLSYSSPQNQATAIADIVDNHLDNGVDQEEIAILIRKHSHASPIIETLESRGHDVVSPALRRGTEFINEFVKPVINWLSEEHHEPRNRIEKQELETKVDEIEESVESWIDVPEDDPLDVFWDAIIEWEDAIENQRNEAYNIRGQLYNLLDKCGLQIDHGDSDLMMGVAITSQIIRSVEEVHRRRLDTDTRRTPRSVMKELYFALKRNQDDFGETTEIQLPQGGITVTTVHQAKGLEWPIVVIPSLNQTDFPVPTRSHETSFPDEIASRYGTKESDERRLFYVAATRAEDRLYLMDTSRGTPENRSPFLEELESEIGTEPTRLDEIDRRTWGRDWDREENGEEPVLVGLSDLLLYLECPYQFGLRRQVNIEPSIGDELGYGEGLHELIQRRSEAETSWDDEEITERTEEHVHLPYMSKPMEDNSIEGIEDRMHTLEELDVFDGEAETEIPVDVVFKHGVVHGEIDYIEHINDGVLVRDWKSNLTHEELIPRYERQLRFYAHVLRKQGHDIARGELVDVGATNEADHLVKREVDVSEPSIDRLIEEINDGLMNIQEEEFEPTPSETVCSSCDMEQLCPYSEAPE